MAVQIFLNGNESDTLCLVYENGNESIQIDRRSVIYTGKYGTEIYKENDLKLIEVEESKGSAHIIVNGNNKYKIKDARRQKFDSD